MKFKQKYNITPEFDDLFSFKSKEDELEHEAKMLMFKFLSELEKIYIDKPIKKKELAHKLKTSASFVTQLYQGNKLVNLLTLAKIQESYNITYEIKAKFNSENYNEEVEHNYSNFLSESKWLDENGYWLYVSKNQVYGNVNIEPISNKNSLKIA